MPTFLWKHRINKSNQKFGSIMLATPPKGVKELYGLIAILKIIIPEWLVELIQPTSHFHSNQKMPAMNSITWQEEPQLRVL